MRLSYHLYGDSNNTTIALNNEKHKYEMKWEENPQTSNEQRVVDELKRRVLGSVDSDENKTQSKAKKAYSKTVWVASENVHFF